MEWYQITQKGDDYIIKEHLHWEENNMYLLLADKEALLIDSGTGVQSIKKEIRKLTDKPISLVLTHAHWDHIGNLHEFDKIYVHKEELTWLEEDFPLSLEAVKSSLSANKQRFPKDFNLDQYKLPEKPDNLIAVSDGDDIKFGNRKIKVIHTPGHSPGSICLYEKENKTLFSGDLIYEGELHCFYPSTDPKAYYRSLEKLLNYDIKTIYPGHYLTPLNLSTLDAIYTAFKSLDNKNQLRFGSGIHKFDRFSIRI